MTESRFRFWSLWGEQMGRWFAWRFYLSEWVYNMRNVCKNVDKRLIRCMGSNWFNTNRRRWQHVWSDNCAWWKIFIQMSAFGENVRINPAARRAHGEYITSHWNPVNDYHYPFAFGIQEGMGDHGSSLLLCVERKLKENRREKPKLAVVPSFFLFKHVFPSSVPQLNL